MEDYIAHRKTGLHYSERKSHKYYKRLETGNKKKPYLYFYTAKEYQAYLNRNKKKSIGDSVVYYELDPNSGKTVKREKAPQTKKLSKDKLFKRIGDAFKKIIDLDDNGRWDVLDVAEDAGKKIKKIADTDKNGRWDVIDKVDSTIKKHSSKTSKKTTQKNPKNQKSNNPKTHKYIAKLLIKGKYRYFYTEAELNAYYNKNPEAKAEREIMSEFDLIKTPETEEQSMAEVNKNFHKSMTDSGIDLEPGWSTNCYDCSLTWEARRRGYDVEAQYDPNGGTDEEISSFYEGVESYQNSDGTINTDSGWDLDVALEQKARNGKETMQEAADMLNDKYEDGARGCLDIYWEGGGGHNVAWEKKDGEIYIHDAQNNTTEKMADYSKAEYVAPNQVAALRTDDKALTKTAASYLEPNDNVDEAKTNKNVTFNYDVKDIENMVNHYNKSLNMYIPDTDEERDRWQAIEDKYTQLKDMDWWNQDRVKKEVYGDK